MKMGGGITKKKKREFATKTQGFREKLPGLRWVSVEQRAGE